MNYWILKTEPSSYSFDRLVAEQTAVWDGVTNPVAVKNIRSMLRGDAVCIYHTGDQKACIGLATVVSAPYPDPKDPKLVVVELKAGKKLAKPVTLAAIKADAVFKEMALVRQGRLSVVPATDTQWRRLMEMAGR